ncbi:glycine betaine ABC transporter substrate-binding protein [Paenibacillus taichungensis]|uniref:ABC transporter substrate-binding protein n=1 Tax=Paenibacillus taichungensis TaxID=484184 RepID=UPI002DBE00CC|nr:glycine betaine ABC transporter substrate-binding protein [Paenibacillus taichungensis]MEC0105852.1 glycine betaine ABC transporter substrate-binding protein [Paenibacillus taichungensis]MEC0196540.1 glycine betaine ABC transporter substrate-binding protein [Paenibacillus taichungensis]
MTTTNKKRWSVIKGGRLLITLGLVLTTVLTAAGCSNSNASGRNDTIVLATKGFAESDILANAFKILVENDTKLKTEVKKLDNTLLWNAIDSGDVDAYVEYSGTALINILKQEPEFDADKAFKTVVTQLKEKSKLIALDPLGFNNTYVFTVPRETAEKYGLKTASQLAEKSGELVFGASEEFLNRPDAWPYVESIYKPKFKETKSIQDPSLQYQAIKQKLIDVKLSYSTDSQILANDLVALEDDKHVFIPYDAFPVVREQTLEGHPELKEVLNKLAGKLDEKAMQKLNAEVEQDQKPALDVARDWLKAQGLIK